jgi:hypothetical protein
MLTQKKIHWGNYKLNNASIIYSSNIEQKLIDELRYSIEGRYHGNGIFVDKIISLDLNPLSIKTYIQRTNGQMLVDVVYNAHIIQFNKYNVFEMNIDKIISSDDTILASTKYLNKVDILCYIKKPKELNDEKKKLPYKEGGKIIVILDSFDYISLKATTISFAGIHFTPENFIRSKLYQKQHTILVDKFTPEQKELIKYIETKEHKADCKHFDRSKEGSATTIEEGKTYIYPAAGNDYNDLFTAKFLPSNDQPHSKSSEFLTLILNQKKYNLTIPTNYFNML